MDKYAIKLPKGLRFTDDEFFEFCQENRDLRFERNTNGEIIIMAPTGGTTGDKNGELTTDLKMWNRQTQRGKAFDSSTGFILPNGATRSPRCFVAGKVALGCPHRGRTGQVCTVLSRFRSGANLSFRHPTGYSREDDRVDGKRLPPGLVVLSERRKDLHLPGWTNRTGSIIGLRSITFRRRRATRLRV